ncbi:MAG: flagellar biosynthetic protein FliO [Rhodospirillales bacterium]|nr:flagellar biosynthetic protein FliO [Rhodospirillales bacterium]
MEIDAYFRFALALVVVLALIGVLTAVARRFGFGYASAKKIGKQKRLAIVEIMPVDAKRRLVLFKRDATEHLVLLGGTADVVVESGIPAPDVDLGAETAATPAFKRIEADSL